MIHKLYVYVVWMDLIFQELESERVKLMEDVQSNKKKMKELEDNLLYRLTSTKVIVALRKNIMIPKWLEFTTLKNVL